ncbi:MAG: LPS ABC transporter substrate-binding protein LptA [Rhizobiaceae bacterium]|nr:MAG: LPS ABC transporter substrate-binding protein LptA [Rhizobiaceae bacterium]
MRMNSGLGASAIVPALLLAPALLLGSIVVQPALAQGNTSTSATTTNGPKLSNDKPIHIESDKLEVHQNQNEAIFTGNVNVVQGDTLLKAGRMVVYYVKSKPGDAKPGDTKDAKAKDGKDAASNSTAKSDVGAGGIALGGASDIDHIEVDGKVYVRSQDQQATGDKGTFDMKTQILTLSGDKVVLTQGQNVVVGCKLVANLKTGQSKVDGCGGNGASTPGRVKMLLAPSKKNGSE